MGSEESLFIKLVKNQLKAPDMGVFFFDDVNILVKRV